MIIQHADHQDRHDVEPTPEGIHEVEGEPLTTGDINVIEMD